MLLQVIGNRFGEQGAVGEERDQEALLLGIGVDVQEVLPYEDFPAREADPETDLRSQLIGSG